MMDNEAEDRDSAAEHAQAPVNGMSDDYSGEPATAEQESPPLDVVYRAQGQVYPPRSTHRRPKSPGSARLTLPKLRSAYSGPVKGKKDIPPHGLLKSSRE